MRTGGRNVRSIELKAEDRFEDQEKTWLESVEADVAELESDKEDVHNRRKWRRNVMKSKSNPIGKTDYKPIICIYIYIYNIYIYINE